MDLPTPLDPTTATVSPGSIVNEKSSSTYRFGRYPNVTPSNWMRPSIVCGTRLSGASRISTLASMNSKMRSAAATAFWTVKLTLLRTTRGLNTLSMYPRKATATATVRSPLITAGAENQTNTAREHKVRKSTVEE